MKSLLSDKYYVTLFGIMECNFYYLYFNKDHSENKGP